MSPDWLSNPHRRALQWASIPLAGCMTHNAAAGLPECTAPTSLRAQARRPRWPRVPARRGAPAAGRRRSPGRQTCARPRGAARPPRTRGAAPRLAARTCAHGRHRRARGSASAAAAPSAARPPTPRAPAGPAITRPRECRPARGQARRRRMACAGATPKPTPPQHQLRRCKAGRAPGGAQACELEGLSRGPPQCSSTLSSPASTLGPGAPRRRRLLAARCSASERGAPRSAEPRRRAEARAELAAAGVRDALDSLPRRARGRAPRRTRQRAVPPTPPTALTSASTSGATPPAPHSKRAALAASSSTRAPAPARPAPPCAAGCSGGGGGGRAGAAAVSR
jgi:hypothetical protein